MRGGNAPARPACALGRTTDATAIVTVSPHLALAALDRLGQAVSMIVPPLNAIKRLVDHVLTTISARDEPDLHTAALVVQAWLDNTTPEDTLPDRKVN